MIDICLRVLSVLSGIRKCPAEGGGVRRVEELPKIWLNCTMSDACFTIASVRTGQLKIVIVLSSKGYFRPHTSFHTIINNVWTLRKKTLSLFRRFFSEAFSRKMPAPFSFKINLLVQASCKELFTENKSLFHNNGLPTDIRPRWPVSLKSANCAGDIYSS